MPKIKTHKATAKRFKVTGSGKLMRRKVGASHLRRRKPKRVRRMYSETVELTCQGEKKRVRRLAPYIKKGE